MSKLTVRYLGRLSYEQGLELQQQTWQQRSTGVICDTLLLLEHENVFTMGRRDSSSNMLLPEAWLSAPVVHCDRGGEMTYHGPGQLVGYFHAKLNDIPVGETDHGPQTAGQTKLLKQSGRHRHYGIGVKELIWRLEETIIQLLRSDYGLPCCRDPEHRGVWLKPREGKSSAQAAAKIAAVGISIKQGVSLHGFALNICTDLRFFEQIVPCGIPDRSVTSLERELSSVPTGPLVPLAPLSQISDQLAKHFAVVFGYRQLDFS